MVLLPLSPMRWWPSYCLLSYCLPGRAVQFTDSRWWVLVFIHFSPTIPCNIASTGEPPTVIPVPWGCVKAFWFVAFHESMLTVHCRNSGISVSIHECPFIIPFNMTLLNRFHHNSMTHPALSPMATTSNSFNMQICMFGSLTFDFFDSCV